MSKAPITRVFVKGKNRDISERIESFRYEDCTKEDDLFQLNIKGGYVYDTADDDDIIAGTILQFQFGFAGIALSEVHEGRITDSEVTYAERIKMTVRAMDLGVVMKKTRSLKVWKGKTTSEIASEIADRYNLEKEIKPTTKVWESVPQGNKSDLKFLEELASKEPSGDLLVYIRSGKLHLEKRGIKKKASVVFRYGEEGVISFAPKYRESTSGTAANSAKTVAVDPKTKQTVTSEDKDKDTKLGKKVIYVDVNANKLETSKTIGGSSSGGSFVEKGKTEVQELAQKIIPIPSSDQSEHNGIAKNANKKDNISVLEATLKIEGNPLLKSNTVITMLNVAKRHSGNWLIEKIVHDISAGGTYTCTLSMVKDGTAKATSKSKKSSADVNNTVGDKAKATKKIPVVYVDTNGGGPEKTKYK